MVNENLPEETNFESSIKESEVLSNIDSNGLENFGIDGIEESTPDLFNSESLDAKDDEFTSFDNSGKENEEDDLEIPAFLRRQKN